MKPTGLFIIWMFITLILTFSLIGIILFIPNGTQPSTWMKLGLNLLDKIKTENEQNIS